MNLSRSRISLALTAALAGGAFVAMPGIAAAQSEGSTGNALVFPYYTANGGWATLFNITNVTDEFLAVKVRFREQENSRDVLDFNVVMSPQDVWTGWVAEGPNGPRFFTKDASCTSPILPKDGSGAAYADFQDVAYTGSSSDGGSTGIERAAEGHLEVFVMGRLPDSQATTSHPTAYWADHEHLDCSIVDANFKVNSGNGPNAVEPSEDNNRWNTHQTSLAGNPGARDDFYGNYCGPYAPLKGNVSFINTARGVGAGSTAMHIEGFAGCNSTGPAGGNLSNLVTAQEYPYFLEPTLASNSGLWGWSFRQRGVQSLFNEWSVNPNTGASTDWIVAFPEKYLHVDIYDDLQAGVNLARLAAAFGPGPNVCQSVFGGYQCHNSAVSSTLAGALAADESANGTLSSVLHPFTEPFDGQSCDEVTFDLWDREENGVRGGGTSISPAPPVPSSALCYETNVITFGGAPSVLDSRLAQTIDTSALTSGAAAGWMKVNFDVQTNGNIICASKVVGGSGTQQSPGQAVRLLECGYGMPVTGFALKERDFGDANKNYGQLMDHGYDQGGLLGAPVF